MTGYGWMFKHLTVTRIIFKGDRYRSDYCRWYFLSGNKESIKSSLPEPQELSGEVLLFLHSFYTFVITCGFFFLIRLNKKWEGKSHDPSQQQQFHNSWKCPWKLQKFPLKPFSSYWDKMLKCSDALVALHWPFQHCIPVCIEMQERKVRKQKEYFIFLWYRNFYKSLPEA